MISLARSGTKPGPALFVCSKCGATQELKTKTATLKPCPTCKGTLFRKETRPVAMAAG